MIGIFDDFGLRFEYPLDWDLDVSEDGNRTTVSVQAPDEPAFAMVTIDPGGAAPEDLADEALAAMREEYPDLEAVPARETIDGHPAVGYDVDFFSMDMASSCAIRCFQTPRRTVLIFGQWSDLDDQTVPAQMLALRKTLEETDAD